MRLRQPLSFPWSWGPTSGCPQSPRGANSGASATTIGVGAVIWLVVTQWLSAGLGGYRTGRLRTKSVNVHTHEVFFRDTAHGFLAWALATVISAALLTSAISSLVSGATTAATTVLSAAAQGAAQGAAQSAGTASDPTAYFVDMLFRTEKPPTAANPQDIRAESSRILVTALSEGNITPADKTHLAQLVASQTGLNQADAEKRVDDVIAQAKTAAEKVKQAGDRPQGSRIAHAVLFPFPFNWRLHFQRRRGFWRPRARRARNVIRIKNALGQSRG